MRQSRLIRLAWALATAAALHGCSLVRQTPEMHYYTLTVPGDPPVRLPGPVRVGTFSADEPYAAERIAYRRSPYRLDYYNYHRWAADPRQLVATTARDYLQRGAAESGVAFEITGHIRRLEEVDADDGWHAALHLDLIVKRGGTLVLERSFAETEPAAERNPEAVAAALSRALGRILDGLVSELEAGGSLHHTPG